MEVVVEEFHQRAEESSFESINLAFEDPRLSSFAVLVLGF